MNIKKIYIISPVTLLDRPTELQLRNYAKNYEDIGYEVYLPFRDTKQNQSLSEIIKDNINAIEKCDEVHIYYLPNSMGIHFDLGAAVALKKSIRYINKPKMYEIFLTENNE